MNKVNEAINLSFEKTLNAMENLTMSIQGGSTVQETPLQAGQTCTAFQYTVATGLVVASFIGAIVLWQQLGTTTSMDQIQAAVQNVQVPKLACTFVDTCSPQFFQRLTSYMVEIVASLFDFFKREPVMSTALTLRPSMSLVAVGPVVDESSFFSTLFFAAYNLKLVGLVFRQVILYVCEVFFSKGLFSKPFPTTASIAEDLIAAVAQTSAVDGAYTDSRRPVWSAYEPSVQWYPESKKELRALWYRLADARKTSMRR
jgi:hypothetical protein